MPLVEMRVSLDVDDKVNTESVNTWLEQLKADRILNCFEDKNIHKQMVRPHLHIFIDTPNKRETVAVSFRKYCKMMLVKESGNKLYKSSQVRDEAAFLAYCCKFDAPQLMRGFTRDEVSGLAEIFWTKNHSLKSKKTTKLGAMTDDLKDKLVDCTNSIDVFKLVLQWHLDNDKLIDSNLIKKYSWTLMLKCNRITIGHFCQMMYGQDDYFFLDNNI